MHSEYTIRCVSQRGHLTSCGSVSGQKAPLSKVWLYPFLQSPAGLCSLSANSTASWPICTLLGTFRVLYGVHTSPGSRVSLRGRDTQFSEGLKNLCPDSVSFLPFWRGHRVNTCHVLVRGVRSQGLSLHKIAPHPATLLNVAPRLAWMECRGLCATSPPWDLVLSACSHESTGVPAEGGAFNKLVLLGDLHAPEAYLGSLWLTPPD